MRRNRGSNSIFKKIFINLKDKFVFFMASLLFLVTKIFPMWLVSNFCGFIAMIFGIFIRNTKIGFKNLKYVMPQYNFFERFKIIVLMWFNLGKFAGEFSYVYRLSKKKIFKIINANEKTKEIIEEIKNNQKGTIIFSGHFSNWEFGLRYLIEKGLKLNVVYRASNNKKFEKKYINGLREKYGIKMIEKKNNAAIKVMKALKNREIVLILMDQKNTKGILCNLIGKPAYTSDSVSIFQKKLNCSVYPFRVVREGLKSKFNVFAEDKLEVANLSSDEITQKVNDEIGKWILENPTQWFLVHDRWRIKKG